MIPSLEELRNRLLPVVGPDSAPNSLFRRKPRLSTTPTRPSLPLPSDSPAPQHLSAPACDHSSAQTAPTADPSPSEQPGAEIGVGGAHSDDQIVEDLADGNCPQRGLFRFRRPATENPTKQRRYFVKEGVFVDHEEEKPITCAGEVERGISDRLLFNLKTLFSKLSLR